MKASVKLLFVALAACLIAACSKKPVSPDTPYIIEGEVPNMEDSIVVTLLEDHGSYYEMVTRDTVMNGKSGLYTKYRINAIPFYVLISPDGKIMETIRGFSKSYIIDAITS